MRYRLLKKLLVINSKSFPDSIRRAFLLHLIQLESRGHVTTMGKRHHALDDSLE